MSGAPVEAYRQAGQSYLLFRLSERGEVFAIPALNVLEILSGVSLNRTRALKHAHLRGVFSFRGDVMPVMDISTLVSSSPSVSSDGVLILSDGMRTMGLAVSEVVGMKEVDASCTFTEERLNSMIPCVMIEEGRWLRSIINIDFMLNFMEGNC